jgi:hypothetical protein
MEYKTAFKHFQKFFKEKTKVEWDLRCEIKQIHKLEKEKEKEEAARVKKGLLEGEKVRPFVWTPPPLGRPVGLLPWGYVRPEERIPDTSSEDSSSGSGTESDGTSSSGSGDDVVYDTNSEVESSDEEEEESSSGEDEDMEDVSAQRGCSGCSKSNRKNLAFVDLASD